MEWELVIRKFSSRNKREKDLYSYGVILYLTLEIKLFITYHHNKYNVYDIFI